MALQNSDKESPVAKTAPAEIGMAETVRILTTASHQKIEITEVHKKAEKKFFKIVDDAAKSVKAPADASVNHDKYIYGIPQD